MGRGNADVGKRIEWSNVAAGTENAKEDLSIMLDELQSLGIDARIPGMTPLMINKN
jgi:hypothetical protein